MIKPSPYYLGADVGGTKTHVLITDANGRVLGFGEAGPGNHEIVGYAGLAEALQTATAHALAGAGLSISQVAGAGFGVAGYDWESERQPTLQAIASLGLKAPLDAVNDTILGLLAGSPNGWGVTIVSGTGCNCAGWDDDRRRQGRVTGAGDWMGEYAGASELVGRAIKTFSHEWTRRGPATRLTQAFIEYTAARDLPNLLEGLVLGAYKLDAAAAPLVFEVATAGDRVAIELIRWAGCELGEMAGGVIRQLGFEAQEFNVVLMGSMFDGGQLLIEPLQEVVHSIAPGAHFLRLTALPVAGAVLLGMEASGIRPGLPVWQSLEAFHQGLR